MPAFTFEKISPPVIGETTRSVPVVETKSTVENRGVLVRILDRLAVSRLQKAGRSIDSARKAIDSVKTHSS